MDQRLFKIPEAVIHSQACLFIGLMHFFFFLLYITVARKMSNDLIRRKSLSPNEDFEKQRDSLNNTLLIYLKISPNSCWRQFPLCCAKSLKSCPTLCDPVDLSLPGSSVLFSLVCKSPSFLFLFQSQFCPKTGQDCVLS